jgi:hypothetical protein
MMKQRKWMLALIFVATSNLQVPLQGQETVFVNLGHLASLHPAWQLADSINRRPKSTILSWSPPTLYLTDLPLPVPTTKVPQLADWVEEQKRRWESELESLQRRRRQILAWQMLLLSPPLPLLDPFARWKFVVQQREKQAAERVRLSLRLSFADMLSPEERIALEGRQRKLDAELEPPPVVPQPIFIPISSTEKFDLTLPNPLTEPQKIFDLIVPPIPSSRKALKIQTPEIGDSGFQLLTDSAVATLREIAMEAARNFVASYARQRGWKVTFSFRPNLLDVTDEVKRAWQHWLESVQPKE